MLSRDRHLTLADWVTSNASPDADLSFSLEDLRSRSRDLTRNDGLAAGIINTIADNVVGKGIEPQIRVLRDELDLSELRLELHRDRLALRRADRDLACRRIVTR